MISQGRLSYPLVPAQTDMLKSPRQVSSMPRALGICFPQQRQRGKDCPMFPESPAGGGKPTYPVLLGRGGGA